MGKRKQKSTKIPKFLEASSNSSENQDNPEISSILLSENRHHDYECSLILHEIQDCVSDIYREYLKDLKLRKQKRLELKVPTSETQHYNLVISSTYLISMKNKIQEVLKNNYTCTLKNIIDEVLEWFIGSLNDFLEEAKDKSRLLQIVYVHEVYHTLQNSITEISKIVVDLYSFEEFTKATLLKFNNNLLSKQKKLLAFAKSQDSGHYAVNSVLKLNEDIESLLKTGECTSNELIYEVGSDYDDVSDEHVHSLPLEELLNYINGSSFKEKHKNKMKKEVDSTALDEEISEFENRLARTLPSTVKVAPFCTHDFLKAMRDKYLEARRLLLHN